MVLELLGVFQQNPALGGDLDVVPVALEQGYPAFLLQFLHGLGNPGLGDMTFLCGSGEAAALADSNKVFDLGQFHGAPPSVFIITKSLGEEQKCILLSFSACVKLLQNHENVFCMH
jgi:hypothetical protein